MRSLARAIAFFSRRVHPVTTCRPRATAIVVRTILPIVPLLQPPFPPECELEVLTPIAIEERAVVEFSARVVNRPLPVVPDPFAWAPLISALPPLAPELMFVIWRGDLALVEVDANLVLDVLIDVVPEWPARQRSPWRDRGMRELLALPPADRARIGGAEYSPPPADSFAHLAEATRQRAEIPRERVARNLHWRWQDTRNPLLNAGVCHGGTD